MVRLLWSGCFPLYNYNSIDAEIVQIFLKIICSLDWIIDLGGMYYGKCTCNYIVLVVLYRFICIYARIARCSNCPHEKRKRTGE